MNVVMVFVRILKKHCIGIRKQLEKVMSLQLIILLITIISKATRVEPSFGIKE